MDYDVKVMHLLSNVTQLLIHGLFIKKSVVFIYFPLVCTVLSKEQLWSLHEASLLFSTLI